MASNYPTLELPPKVLTYETEDKYTLKKAYTKADYFLSIPSKEVKLNPNLANNNSEYK